MSSKLFLCLTVALTSAWAIAEIPKELDQPLERAFVPKGFDDNDSVQVVVTGKFPNTCYQVGVYSTSVDSEQRTVEIHLSAYRYESNCLDVEVPFFQVVHLGRMGTRGDYRVLDGSTKKELGTLEIAASPEGGTGTDDVTYAPLLDAYVLKRGARRTLVLDGVFSDSCLRVAGIELRAQREVLVALPRLGKKKSGPCEKGEYAFHKTLPIAEDLPHSFLLHVRTSGGQAINKMIVGMERTASPTARVP